MTNITFMVLNGIQFNSDMHNITQISDSHIGSRMCFISTFIYIIPHILEGVVSQVS